jgi:hypothetical protein
MQIREVSEDGYCKVTWRDMSFVIPAVKPHTGLEGFVSVAEQLK